MKMNLYYLLINYLLKIKSSSTQFIFQFYFLFFNLFYLYFNSNKNKNIDFSKMTLEELMFAEDPDTHKWKTEAKNQAVLEAFEETQKKQQQQQQQNNNKSSKQYNDYLLKLKEWEKKSKEYKVSLSPLRFLRFFAKQPNLHSEVLFYYQQAMKNHQQLDLESWNNVLNASLELKRTDQSIEILHKIHSLSLSPKPQLILNLISLLSKDKERIIEASQLFKQNQSVLDSIISNDLKKQLKL